nr:DUF523 and DUF1722 domain-containing protein [Deltaproteobacteria bacterium]
MNLNTIKVGISACLLGHTVRYDGGHKLDRFLTDTLGRYVQWVPVCPEVECGLPVPREAMRLVGDPDHPRLVTRTTRVDHTERMIQWAARRITELEQENLSGFIFKSRSPSSGMQGVTIYTEDGMPGQRGSGLFAKLVMQGFPLLPVEDDGRLHDPQLRENFIERLFVYHRWKRFLTEDTTTKGFVDFHTRHKLLIMAHSPRHLRELGALAARPRSATTSSLLADYQSRLIEGLKLLATVKKNTNVLSHIMGYFKTNLTADEKQELLEVIEDYHQSRIPLIVPIVLLRHYVRKYSQEYLSTQYYLNPHPLELKLRNHV